MLPIEQISSSPTMILDLDQEEQCSPVIMMKSACSSSSSSSGCCLKRPASLATFPFSESLSEPQCSPLPEESQHLNKRRRVSDIDSEALEQAREDSSLCSSINTKALKKRVTFNTQPMFAPKTRSTYQLDNLEEQKALLWFSSMELELIKLETMAQFTQMPFIEERLLRSFVENNDAHNVDQARANKALILMEFYCQQQNTPSSYRGLERWSRQHNIDLAQRQVSALEIRKCLVQLQQCQREQRQQESSSTVSPVPMVNDDEFLAVVYEQLSATAVEHACVIGLVDQAAVWLG